MNKLAKVTNNQLSFDPETVDLIKRTIAVGATDTELQLFLYQAQRSGLDPIARQIYFIKMGDKVNIQASIDGLRLVAQRNPNYAGQDEPVFEEENGKLKVAKVTVYKFSPTGQRYPAAVGVAYWDEYKPSTGKDFMWNKMPHTMLAKVAEALALRKALPQELSGIYSQEEMDQAGPSTPVTPLTPENEPEEPKSEMVREAEKTFGTETMLTPGNPSELTPEEKEEYACTCGTTNRYHKVGCPARTP